MMKIDIASRVDHTLLKMGVSKEVLNKFVSEGVKYMVRGLVVSPYNVSYVREFLKHMNYSNIRLVSVVSFPLGETFLDVKLREINKLCEIGIDDIDIVTNVSNLINSEFDKFREEVESIVEYAKNVCKRDTILKLIVEVTLLNKQQLERAIDIVNEFRPDYLKTSTGYGPRGVNKEDVVFIRSRLDPSIKIKASGGIRSYHQALELIKAGAEIIGSSRGVDIIKEALEYEEKT